MVTRKRRRVPSYGGENTASGNEVGMEELRRKEDIIAAYWGSPQVCKIG